MRVIQLKHVENVVTWKTLDVRKFSRVPNVILKLTVITMEPGIFT